MSNTHKELNAEELDALIHRVTEAQKHNLALSSEDLQLLLDALLSLAAMHNNLADNDITIAKLRKLAGLVSSSESLGKQVKTGKGKPQPRRKRNKPDTPPVKPDVVKHEITHVCKGQQCPECQKGKLYKFAPATFLRITGQTPFVPEQHVLEKLRCNTCGAYFTADLPDEVKADGESGQKYGHSVASIVAVSKFFAGTPYYRQGSMQDMLGVALPASTIFDLTERVANAAFPVFRHLVRILAADAVHFYMDDTSNRIIKQQPVIKPNRNGKGERSRTGVYTSGIIALLATGERIVLYETNVGHAGEFLDDILKNRSPDLPMPVVMSDALSSNKATVIKTIETLCNSHARRMFYDIQSHFPEEVEHVLEQYSLIWQHDTRAIEQELSPKARLAWHRERSLPVMAKLRNWGNKHIEDNTVEQNSALGKAIAYFDKHYDGLTGFCQHEGAQLDNNEMETALKLPVRNRKNAGSFRTGSGAAVGDVVTSLIATSKDAGANPVDYFNVLQRNANDVKANPEKYLPWNYPRKKG